MVSVDELDGNLVTKDAYEVPFPVLSDPDATVHTAYAVVNELDDAGVERLKGLGLDIERWSKRKHHKVAIPSMFLIDQQGLVQFAHAAHDYKSRPKTEKLLEVLADNRAKRRE